MIKKLSQLNFLHLNVPTRTISIPNRNTNRNTWFYYGSL